MKRFTFEHSVAHSNFRLQCRPTVYRVDGSVHHSAQITVKPYILLFISRSTAIKFVGRIEIIMSNTEINLCYDDYMYTKKYLERSAKS